MCSEIVEDEIPILRDCKKRIVRAESEVGSWNRIAYQLMRGKIPQEYNRGVAAVSRRACGQQVSFR